MNRQQLQKHKNQLIMSGIAIIVFAFWDVLQVVTYLLFGNRMIDDAASGIEDGALVRTVFYILLFSFCIVVLFLKLYIGLHAIREGHGEKGGNRYWILSILLFALSLGDIVNSITTFESTYITQQIMDFSVSLFSTLAILQLIRATYLIRKFTRGDN